MSAVKNSQNVTLSKNEIFHAVEFDFSAGIFREENLVTDFEFHRLAGALFVKLARTNSQNFAVLRLFFGGVWKDDAARGLFFSFELLDYDPVC